MGLVNYCEVIIARTTEARKCCSEDMEIFFINFINFCQFFGFFDIYLFQIFNDVSIKQMMADEQMMSAVLLALIYSG